VKPPATIACALAALLGLIAVGCSEPRLRVPALPYAVALRDLTPRTIRVVGTWDATSKRPVGSYMQGDVTHWVEVDVLNPDGTTEPQTWPYDEDDLGLRPPSSGTELVVAPAEWLAVPGTLPRRPSKVKGAR